MYLTVNQLYWLLPYLLRFCYLHAQVSCYILLSTRFDIVQFIKQELGHHTVSLFVVASRMTVSAPVLLWTVTSSVVGVLSQVCTNVAGTCGQVIPICSVPDNEVTRVYNGDCSVAVDCNRSPAVLKMPLPSESPPMLA